MAQSVKRVYLEPGICIIEGCTAPRRYLPGWCDLHKARISRYGDPDAYKMTRRGEPLAWLRRMVSEGDRSAGCWPFEYCQNGPGYGRVSFEGKMRAASNVALILDGKPFDPEKPFALHSCDNPPCVNPDHLRWGTPKENAADAIERGRAVLTAGGRASRKLSPEDVVEIRRRLATIPEGSRGGIRSGLDSARQIAKDFGVAHSAISNIKLGKQYTDYAA